MRRRAARLCQDKKADQAEKNKKLEKYYKFEKEWLKTIKKQGSEK